MPLLARYLGPDQPVYGLQPNNEEPSTDIVEMASAYIVAMRAVQSTGPYYLVGHSAGGLIALEMAQQLRRQGEQVGLVGVLDTYASTSQSHSPELLNARFVWRLLRDMPGYLTEYLLDRPMRERIESLRVYARVAGERLARLRSHSPDSKARSIRAMLFEVRTERACRRAPSEIWQCCARPFPGRTQLYSAAVSWPCDRFPRREPAARQFAFARSRVGQVRQ